MLAKSCTIFLLVFITNVLAFNTSSDIPDDIYKDPEINNMTVPQIIAFYKYPVEVHSVTTKDGYILEVHRIPNPGKPPVLLGHGFICSSADFVISGPNHALSFVLFDQGYDVWIMNFRGSRYSRKHKTLNPDKDSKFWNFSMHEHGVYDLRAGIDHVLNQTGFSILNYVGYSMGTSYFFVLSSELPEYDQKINLMVGLSPVMFLNNPKGLIFSLILQNQDLVDLVMNMFPTTEVMPFVANTKYDQFMKLLLRAALMDMAGPDASLFTEGYLDALFGHSPAGTSMKLLIHWSQNVRFRSFRKFNYGTLENAIRYKSLFPPKYDTKRNTIPKVFFYARNDYLISMKDVERIPSKVSNLLSLNLVKSEHFNHLDFAYSKYAKSLVYDQIVDLLRNYNK